ncbi:MAG: hypothetical protein ACK5MQ_17600 [Pikeienuella sp.]
MTELADISSRTHLPPALPTVATGLELTVIYTPQAVEDGLPDECVDLLVGDLDKLGVLLRAGFLMRPIGARFARLALERAGPDRSRVIFEGDGGHINLLTVLLRIVHSHHHTPDGAFEELVAAIGDEDEARAVFGGITFTGAVERIEVTATGIDGAVSVEIPFDRVIDDASGSDEDGGEALIEAGRLKVSGFPAGAIDPAIEDALLTMAGVPAFIPIGADPEFEPGEEEIFRGAEGEGAPLIIDNISIQRAFLFEMLNCISGEELDRASLRLEIS